MFYGHSGIDNL